MGKKEYWRTVSPAEMEERKRRERDRLIAEAKARFNAKGLTDSEIYSLSISWKLTEEEIATHWDVYPCQLNWALRRSGCGCTAIEPYGDQLCGRDAPKAEVLSKLNRSRK